ncbi:Hemolysin, contains CBS domains [Haloarcula vallismortis]|uniref:CBS domain-containing protein n=2 Tax=Haloarcula vallismortis TaxID=28442 RepID=M0J718_HALVA|nr:hemolysin family protein [Haloarcula vallismortis]EMA03799.1 CBS domain-containing protein [Haloarcula vallismortis ATCC 29715]SDW31456.1 Hemolysin, contains CBS domains [Haloarcula vallismortis]
MALDPPAPFELSTATLQAIEYAGVTIPQDAVLVGGVVTLVALVVLSAFFSSSEIAMFSLPAHRTEALVEDAVPGAKTLKQLKSDPHRLLVTILVGNNLVNIAMSSIATGLLAMYVDSQGLAVAIATFGITAIVLLFGESAPKSYAVENTESWALRISKPLKVAEKVLLPLILLFDYLTRVVNKITGGRSAIETSYVTRQEIQDIIETGEREGVLDEDEREMLQRTLRFNDTIAKEVMTPRLDMTAVAKESSAEEALETCIQSGHARIPVYEGSLDNVIGVIHIRDLVRDLNYGEALAKDMDLEDLIEPTLHVPESKNVDDLLTEMRAERLHMVIVIDEFGTTEGLVTMEDLTEEIVGEILEGEEEEPIEYVGDDTVTVKGEVNIEEVNEALDLDLPEGEEFETIAGFIFNRAGRLVEEGETITYDGVEIRVEQVENTRIMKARVVRLETDATEPVDAEEASD